MKALHDIEKPRDPFFTLDTLQGVIDRFDQYILTNVSTNNVLRWDTTNNTGWYYAEERGWWPRRP